MLPKATTDASEARFPPNFGRQAGVVWHPRTTQWECLCRWTTEKDMRALLAAAAIALIVMPVHAEAKGGGRRHQSDQVSAQKKPDDNAYKKALRSIPDQKPVDPWAGTR